MPALGVNSSARIKDLPASERPRERLAERGADALQTAELIAILLRTGLQGRSALRVAEDLLQRFPKLDELARASLDEIQHVPGIGRDKAIALKAAFTLAERMARELRNEPPVLEQPEQVADLLREEFRLYDVERLHVLLLNVRRRLIRVERLAHGNLDSVLAHPRDVFRAAVAANAAYVLLVHNHPSGDPTPSEADVKLTRDLIRAGRLLRIEVTDHVILGRATKERPRDWISLRALGHFAD